MAHAQNAEDLMETKSSVTGDSPNTTTGIITGRDQRPADNRTGSARHRGHLRYWRGHSRTFTKGRPSRSHSRSNSIGGRICDPDLLVLKYDITDEGASENIVQDVSDRFGRLDVLVNNAARRHLGLIVDTAGKGHRRRLPSEYLCSDAMTAAAAKVMAAQREGTIVTTIGVATSSTYSASKGALFAYTRAAAVELAPYNIRVNAVAPGMTSTPLIDSWAAVHADPEKARNDVVDAVPLGRLAKTEDVAGAVSYLASLDARCVTGISLPIDGGYTAQ